MFSDISTRILVFSNFPLNILIKLPCLLVYLSLNISESPLYFSVRVQSDIAGSLMRFLRQKMGEGFFDVAVDAFSSISQIFCHRIS